MANLLSSVLRPFGLDPSEGYDTAAAGARKAGDQANALSALQWQRQMQGLQGALGYVQNLQDLYNSIYSPGGGMPAAGGSAPPGPSASAIAQMTRPQEPGVGNFRGTPGGTTPWTPSNADGVPVQSGGRGTALQPAKSGSAGAPKGPGWRAGL